MKAPAQNIIVAMLLLAWLPTVAAHTDIETQLTVVSNELASRPHDYLLYLRRAELRRDQQDWLGAEADFAQVDRWGPVEVRDALGFYRGRLYQEAGQSGRAISAISVYLSKYPDHIDALRIRAIAFAQLQLFDEAIADYGRLIVFDAARSPELWLERARLYVQAADVDSSLASIDNAIATFGPLITLIEFGVNTEVNRKNYAAALERLETLPPMLAKSPKWLWRRGTLLDELSRADEAALSYAQARDAIDRLPARRRQTPAIQELLSKLDAQ